ncbi:MAG: Helix-turn-helix domain protein [Chitinophagaceae bacterium]|nr:Helix-turn-helix domain protein [Chitinophagaceae bacterium]
MILEKQMTDFRFHSVVPHTLLQPFVDRISVFESSGRLPAVDRKLIVPNANLKLTLTYRNGISVLIDGKKFIQNENKLSLSGLIDTPVILDATEDAQTGTIIIEFNALGTYRFFHLGFSEFKNQIIELPDLIGNEAEKLRSRLSNTHVISDKLQLLQAFLIQQLEKIPGDPVFDYCIQRILNTNGLATVAQLEKETGYSSRWLHKKFLEYLGTGPKNFSEIIRFKQFYQAYSNGMEPHVLKGYIYNSYHDQSHFIRAFKRFTGTTLSDLQKSTNELSIRNFKR